MNKAETKTLFEVAEIIMGQSPDSESYNDKGEGIPFYQGKSDFGEIYPTVRMYCTSPKKIAMLDDILMSVRAPIGDVNIAQEECCIGRGLAAIRPKDNTNLKYLFYLLDYYKERLAEQGTGSTFKAIGKDVLKEFKVPMWPLDRQQLIADIIGEIQNLIFNRKEALSVLDDLVKSRFVEMFGNLSKGSDSENSITLQEMLDRKWITYHLDGNHGGDYPRSHEFIDDGVPYISANCIVNGKIDFSRGKYVSEERANRFRKGIACNKDVLFAHNATVGPVVVLETQYPKVILGTSLTAYRCDCEHIIPEYLKAYMEHPIFTQQYEADMQQTTRNQVPITKQRNYRFIIPKMSYQKEFAAFVELTDKSKLSIQQSIETLQTLKAKLMQDYFG